MAVAFRPPTQAVQLVAPLTYFGGKRLAARTIWQALGLDVHTYIEPFFGSGAVLFGRPGNEWERLTETANDINCFVVNFFRAIQHDPEAVAYYCRYPIHEIELHSRHLWLVQQEVNGQLTEALQADPNYYDAKIAGWWAWGASAWIGDGWCDVEEYRRRLAGYKPKNPRAGTGLLPTPVPELLINRGIHALQFREYLQAGGDQEQDATEETENAPLRTKRPRLNRVGNGVHTLEMRDGDKLLDRLLQLHYRLRHVRILCGDWQRCISKGAADWNSSVAVFLDPPYVKGGYVYGRSLAKRNVAQEALDWAKEHWYEPNLRIAYCGWEGELDVPSDWRVYKWASNGIKAKRDANTHNRFRERVWFSPACLSLEVEEQGQQCGPVAAKASKKIAATDKKAQQLSFDSLLGQAGLEQVS